MKYKEFSDWCNARAQDGCWGMKEARICISILNEIERKPFWRREKIWKFDYEHYIVSNIIIPINDKIRRVKNYVDK